MNMLSSLSAIRVNVLIGSVYKILTELFSNLLMSLIEFNWVFSTSPFPSLSNDAWLNSFLSNWFCISLLNYKKVNLWLQLFDLIYNLIYFL